MKRSRRRLAALVASAAIAAANGADAKVEDPNDLIQGRWYATEVVIFEREEDADPGPEALLREGGRSWPARTRAFAEPMPWRIAGLDPLTRACLEFPRLDLVSAATTPQLDATAPGDTARPEPVALGPPPDIEPSLAPHPLLDLLQAAARQQVDWRRDSYRWLPERSHALNAQAKRIRNAQGLNLIWHGRWVQPVPSRSESEPLMLAVPATADHGRVSGTLAVTLGRFLHFNATLWLEEPGDGQDGLVPFMQLSEARTMRLEELHYLDHPRLGVLVRINRAPPSPALVRALRTWEASVNG
ncbi:MAG: CsiV family protein [Gammaproteobacteria bacterium]|nr:CsiV family protein [Gammaproteobacteria bacterium]